jgi:apolipoprotein N-acyltransferase
MRVAGSHLYWRGAELLAGGPRAALPGNGYYNAAFVIAPDGTTRGIYDKRVLLPFGEYFPFGTGPLARRQFGTVRRFVPGQPTLPLPTVAGRAGVLICNEAFYPQIAAERVRDGAEWLVVLANDSWAGEARFAEIAAAMAVFRAVEFRRDLVRASTWGPSWVVDARGEMDARMVEGVAGARVGMVRRRSAGTVYGWLGDGFAVACALVAGIAVTRAKAWG